MKNKTALITGASSGIGLELAKIHAAKKGNIVIVARREEKLIELKLNLEKKYGISVEVLAKDLSKSGAVDEIYKYLKEKGIAIDYLINNAGFGDFGFFYETSWKKESDMIELNIKTLTYLTKLFVQDMVKRGSGKIMNVASTAAFQPGPLMAIYYASKSYVLAFSEAIANELKDTGVTVTVLCPGPTQTEFVDTANLNESKLFKIMSPVSSKIVAQYGYKQMLAGKTVAVQGFMNKIMTFSIRFTPRNIAVGVVRKMQEKSS